MPDGFGTNHLLLNNQEMHFKKTDLATDGPGKEGNEDVKVKQAYTNIKKLAIY